MHNHSEGKTRYGQLHLVKSICGIHNQSPEFNITSKWIQNEHLNIQSSSKVTFQGFPVLVALADSVEDVLPIAGRDQSSNAVGWGLWHVLTAEMNPEGCKQTWMMNVWWMCQLAIYIHDMSWYDIHLYIVYININIYIIYILYIYYIYVYAYII